MAGPIIEAYSIVQKQGSYRRVKNRIVRLIEQDPQTDYYLALAQLEARKQNWDQAMEAAKTALKLEPLRAEAQLLLAQVLEAKHDLEEASRAYQSLLDCHPQFSKGYREFARYLLSYTDSLPLAKTLLFKSLELDPQDAIAHTILAEVYVQQERIAQAMLHLEIAARFHEGQAYYYHQIAKLLMEMENYEEAIKQYKLALQRDPRNKAIRSQLKEAKKAKQTHKSRIDDLETIRIIS